MRVFTILGAVLLALSVGNFALGNLAMGFSTLAIAVVSIAQSRRRN